MTSSVQLRDSQPVVLWESLCVPEQFEPRTQADKGSYAVAHVDLKATTLSLLWSPDLPFKLTTAPQLP
jgi:hypothetical protein